MDRREVLKGIGVSAVGGAVLSGVPAEAALRSGPVPLSDKYEYPGVTGRIPVNKPRAYAVMEEMKVDGLIALDPINVFYLTNTTTIGTKFRSEYPAFATFPRDPQQPSFLIAGASQALEMANGDREVPEIIVVAGAANWQDYVDATPEQLKIEPIANGAAYREAAEKEARRRGPPTDGVDRFMWRGGGFAIKAEGPFTEHEQRWATAQKVTAARSAPTPAWALAKALKESGLSKGTLAVDDMRIAYLLEEIGMTGVKCVPGYKIFQKIRMVKSEEEIALQRIGGYNNAIAAMNTIYSIEKGMTFAEIDRRFRTEASALGSDTQSFIAGVSLALFPDGITVPGKPFLVDAVSHYNQYHGDFGRTVVIGEPSKETLAREKAHKLGRDAVFDIVKPGVKFSELRRVAKETQVKAGLPEQVVIVSPHSVGLQHDDNPSRMDTPFGGPYDHVLEENMVLTIDLANVEIGWGAGHHEDLFRVTKTGFEYMAPPGDPLVIV
jgi:Xaa-Pro aminopeptidase